MKDLLLPLLHLAVTAAKLCRPGGVRAVIAENLLLKQQLIVLRRSRQRAPNLRVGDRLLCGFGALFLSPGRIRKVAIGLRPPRHRAGRSGGAHRRWPGPDRHRRRPVRLARRPRRGRARPGVGTVQRAWVHVPVRRPVEPFPPVRPVANGGFGQRAVRPPATRAGIGAVAVVAVVVHGPAGPHGGAGAPA